MAGVASVKSLGQNALKEFGGEPPFLIFGVPVPGTGKPPYGDDPNDQGWIKRGYRDFKKFCP
jgi:hypothetical protein